MFNTVVNHCLFGFTVCCKWTEVIIYSSVSIIWCIRVDWHTILNSTHTSLSMTRVHRNHSRSSYIKGMILTLSIYNTVFWQLSILTFVPLTWPGNEAMSLYHTVLIVVLLYCPATTQYWQHQYFTVHLQQYWQYLIVHLPHTIGSILLSIHNSIGNGLLSVYEHYHFH